ncbi:MAG: signal peptidase I [Gammaproteobacteria bacterium HGW-Gammaproteobacteria-11]|nr:MAG: signal peptidase I [Gammaproteobacteria bacterium HGW-Gammaproteobacteria-11]
MLKKRSPLLAAALSLLAPGLGHVYAGNARKGLLLLGTPYGMALLVGFAGLFSTFYGLVGLLLFLIAFYMFAIVSAVRLALRQHEYQLRPYNRWYGYLGIFIVTTLLGHALFGARGSMLGYETYHIPGQSMDTALQVGDFITVNTRYAQPQVGDVIVFLYPEDRSIPYVKRVAALGNDRVSIEGGQVLRNGEPVSALSVPAQSRQRDYSITMAERRVPADEVFLLGDWRDNSNDSRFWGTVPTADIVGKVTYVWFSTNLERIGMAIN